MSDLVGNPEDRFSHNEAHIIKKLLTTTDWHNCFLYLYVVLFVRLVVLKKIVKCENE